MFRSLLFGIPVLVGCSNALHGNGADTKTNGKDDTGTTTTTDPVDADGDGYDTTSDCDDTNPNIYPGAPELCDGLDDDCDGVIPGDETDEDGNGVVECEEACDTPQLGGAASELSDCEYTPDASGTPFSVRVEWNMTQPMVDPSTGKTLPAYTFADDSAYTSVFQAPAVSQTTDDNGDGVIDDKDIPDIAVVMADVAEDKDGVLRLISGDGTSVLASTHWQSFTNANGTDTYAPYHYAGLALADIDGDGLIDIPTLVVGSTGYCYPGAYEVDDTSGSVKLTLTKVYTTAYTCEAHAPSVADLDHDGEMEVIYGRGIFEGDTWKYKWYGTGGRGWYGELDYGTDAYWNSGYHAFAYDMDGDGTYMEVVAGRTVYNHDGSIYCELGSYSGSQWVDATDGYPAVADIARFKGDTEGEPEIVVTGNEWVSVFHGTPAYDPNGLARCVMIDQLPNDPTADDTLPAGLPAPASCDATAQAFGGPPTVADFDGDGQDEIGVSGACWYSVFKLDSKAGLSRYALTNTRDWSSASTGSTVFDFNGDQKAEVVFSDEQALYVWGVDTKSSLKPWERLVSYLTDTSHKSWTIHEYPIVADVDNDGKAEIIAVNSHLPPDHEDSYGIYVLGAADDDWVSARTVWNQHAYYVTNVDDSYETGYCDPNYAPYSAADYNSFRQQSPGAYGSLQASNLTVDAEPLCQEGCGDVTVRVHVTNDSAHVTVDGSVVLALYGVNGATSTLLQTTLLGSDVPPGTRTDAYEFTLTSAVWSAYDSVEAIVDDPATTGIATGAARECDETDNTVLVPLTSICP